MNALKTVMKDSLRRAAIIPILAIGVSWAVPWVQAGEVVATKIDHDDGRFRVHSDMLLNIPVSEVRLLLGDFRNLPSINNDIKNVEFFPDSLQGHQRMRIQSEVCALMVCLDYNWVQEVRVSTQNEIFTRFDPTLSDFRMGWVRYRFRREGSSTRLIMDAELEPDFWFPPVIGPMLIKSKLRDEALETALGIEKLRAYAINDKGRNRFAWRDQISR
jgi:hypothetical protein